MKNPQSSKHANCGMRPLDFLNSGVRAPLSKWVKIPQLDQWNISYISVSLSLSIYICIYIYICILYIYMYYIYIYVYYIYICIIYICILYICICIYGMNIIVSYMDCKPRIRFLFVGQIDSTSHENSLRSQPLMVLNGPITTILLIQFGEFSVFADESQLNEV